MMKEGNTVLWIDQSKSEIFSSQSDFLRGRAGVRARERYMVQVRNASDIVKMETYSSQNNIDKFWKIILIL